MHPALACGLVVAVGCAPPPAVDPAPPAARAITNGTDDAGDPEVVLVHGPLLCSGSLIAPRVVLTAAHCVESGRPREVVFGASDAQAVLRLPVVYAEAHPAFGAAARVDDVGLLLLESPASVAPLAFASGALPVAFGDVVRLVGFGASAADGSGAGTKRSGSAEVSAIDEKDFLVVPAPALSCVADSGGAALASDGVLVGVVSRGDDGCAEWSRLMRVDVYGELIAGFVARTDDGAVAAGERCYYDGHCGAGACAAALDDGRLRFCVVPCASNADCEAGLSCSADAAGTFGCRHQVPSPGSLGAACEGDSDCEDRVCAAASPEAAGSCARRCFLDAPELALCADGLECRRDARQPERAYCAVPSEEEGCSCRGAGGLGAAAALLLRLRRRGRARRSPECIAADHRALRARREKP